MSKPTTILLRDIDSGKSRAFEPEHAKRLLALPNTRWREVGEPASIGKADLGAAVDHHVKVAKKPAAAPKTGAAPASAAQQADETKPVANS